MKNLELRMISDSFDSWYVYALLDGDKVLYKTGDPKSMVSYCKYHFGITIPMRDGIITGLSHKNDCLKYSVK